MLLTACALCGKSLTVHVSYPVIDMPVTVSSCHRWASQMMGIWLRLPSYYMSYFHTENSSSKETLKLHFLHLCFKKDWKLSKITEFRLFIHLNFMSAINTSVNTSMHILILILISDDHFNKLTQIFLTVNETSGRLTFFLFTTKLCPILEENVLFSSKFPWQPFSKSDVMFWELKKRAALGVSKHMDEHQVEMEICEHEG